MPLVPISAITAFRIFLSLSVFLLIEHHTWLSAYEVYNAPAACTSNTITTITSTTTSIFNALSLFQLSHLLMPSLS